MRLYKCKKCGKTARYLPTKEFEGVGCTFPYRFVLDWYKAQEKYVSSLDLSTLTSEAIATDTVRYSLVIPYKKKEHLAKSAQLSLFGDRLVVSCGGTENTVLFSQISSMAVLGKNKINMYVGGDIFQFKGNKRFCALKYVNVYFHHSNTEKGLANGEFLGL